MKCIVKLKTAKQADFCSRLKIQHLDTVTKILHPKFSLVHNKVKQPNVG